MINGLVSANCFNEGYFLKNLILMPYGQGVSNLARVCCSRNNENNKPISLCKRPVHLLVGLTLLIPIINSVALYILCKMQIRFEEIQLTKRNNAAIIFQKNYRGHKARKLCKAHKMSKESSNATVAKMPKPSKFATLVTKFKSLPGKVAGKVVRVFNKPSGQAAGLAVAKKVTGIDWLLGYFSLKSFAFGIGSLRQGRVRLAGVALLTGVGHAINSIFGIFVPREVKAIGHAQYNPSNGV